MTGSNRRPPACKAGALPAELIPQSYTDIAICIDASGASVISAATAETVVGLVWIRTIRPPPYQDGALTN